MKENGVVRRRLSGKEADPYIGIGRKILGEMKNIMRLGGIQQLSWTKDLQNGVRIMVSSIFGQDAINISVPLPYQLAIEQPVRSEEIEWSTEFIAGSVGSTPMACYWENGQLKLLETIGQYSSALAISADGKICGGTYFSAGLPVAVVWINGAAQSLGFNGEVTAISDDGSVVAGTIYGGDGRSFVWSQTTGARMLDKLSGGGADQILKVSSDNSTIVGNSGSQAAKWDAITGKATSLGSDFFIEGCNLDGSIVCGAYVGGVGSQPAIVANGAMEIINTGLGEGIFYGISDDGNTLVMVVTEFHQENTAVFNRSTGEVKALNGRSFYVQISQDGSTIAGTLRYSASERRAYRASTSDMVIQLLSDGYSHAYDIKINKQTQTIQL